MTLRRGEIIGRLGSDPELKHVADTPLASVSVATEMYGDDEAVWVNFELWGPDAETFAEYASQGSYIRAEGQLELDAWDGGAELKIVARSSAEWTFMDSGGGGSDGGSQQGGQPPPAEPRGDFGGEPGPAGGDDPVSDDEIPF